MVNKYIYRLEWYQKEDMKGNQYSILPYFLLSPSLQTVNTIAYCHCIKYKETVPSFWMTYTYWCFTI